jgi:hypothetical protein
VIGSAEWAWSDENTFELLEDGITEHQPEDFGKRTCECEIRVTSMEGLNSLDDLHLLAALFDGIPNSPLEKCSSPTVLRFCPAI